MDIIEEQLQRESIELEKLTLAKLAKREIGRLQKEKRILKKGVIHAHAQLEAIEMLLSGGNVPVQMLSFGVVQRVADMMRDGWSQK